MHWLAVLIGAYLLGSFPGSLLAARWAGRDVRRTGDGNVGAHNVMRHVGRGWGVLALVLDAGKGALAVFIALQLQPESWLPTVAGWSAVLGHNYPLWLRFRGGKGLATGLGVALALLPALWWLVGAASLVLLALTRNLAFSGACVALLLSGATWIADGSLALVAAPLGILGLLAIAQFPDLLRMWQAAPDKRALLLNRWIRDRDAKL